MNQGSPPPNGAGAPGTPGTPGAAGMPMQQQLSQQGQPGQQQPIMYRPEQMRNIKELTAQERSKYETGLRVLWQTVAEKPEGSQEREIARRKILEFTPVLARKIRERRLAALNRQNALKQQQQEGGGQPMQQTADGQPTAQQLQQAQAAAQAQAHAAAMAAQGQNPAQVQQAQANAQAQAQLRANAAAAAANPGARQGAAGTPPAGPQQQAQQGAAGPQQQARPQQPPKFSDSVLQNLSLLTYHPPPALADKPAEVVAKWQEDVRKKLGVSLTQIEMARANIAKLEANYKMRVSNNQLSPEDMKVYKDRRDMLQKVLDDSARFVAVFRKQQDQTKVYIQQKMMQQQAATGGAAAGGQQQPQRPPQQAGAPAQQPTPQQAPQQQQQQKNIKTEPTNMQNSQANINGAIEAAKKESIAAGARQGTGNNVAINNANNNGGAANAPSKPTPGIVQQTPIPPPVIPAAAMQGAPKQPPKPPVQTPVHPPPTPINTSIAAASKMAGPATAGTPTPTPTPASAAAAAAAAAAAGRVPAAAQMATPVNTAPRALSHQKALEEANKQRAASIGSGAVPTPPAGHVAAANGAAPNSGAVTPGGGNNANAAAQNQQMHMAQHQAMQQNQMAMNQQQQQATAAAAAAAAASNGANGANGAQNGSVSSATQEAARINAKMTEPRQMSKQLSEKASQMPQPVSLGGGIAPGRPTLTGGGGVVGGVLGQAAIAKVPAIQIEGEGERVLNKKRLDELVRQVCGGTAEGHEGNLLQPEVEESVLNLADSFVDSVLHSACRNAKERGSKVLEIRDLQLVLERTYNIRIPGYSSDELRTVRKVQPSMAWITKMSVIQAAKVTSATKNDL
ncbi:Transcription initiation factor TFIID subunit 12 [Sporothrix bragantina]|uniref:Transcription initiation factor TFIID subunit 12 n=1 Tax=Sporothrix bragantina TaxID=671064 RepID=A0ABP0BE35_9PEZI